MLGVFIFEPKGVFMFALHPPKDAGMGTATRSAHAPSKSKCERVVWGKVRNGGGHGSRCSLGD